MFILVSIIIMSFPVNAITGMYFTMLACLYNAGRLRTLQMLLIAQYGWFNCTFAGMALQAIVLWKLNTFFIWI